MFTDIDVFLRFFRSVNRRAVRDVNALPPEADGWTPIGAEGATLVGEGAWSINKLIGHMCGSRLYFASAYRREGWVSPDPPDVSRPELWGPALDASYEEFSRLVAEVGNEGLTRDIEMIDTPGATLTGWRVLMMMMEHDIHHRSQIDTYAGMNGWDPPDIFFRSAETIATKQEEQIAKYRS
ncbi:MAG: hypothetical protein OXH38_00575 [Chloroflexi bacterium]|nr:hypothetical protein [Chloroflexota bacterium]